MQNVSVLGGGAWGTALALALSRTGKRVLIVVRDCKVADDINKNKRNEAKLGNVALNDKITATTDPAQIACSSLIVAAIPAQSMRGALSNIRDYVEDGTTVVSASKGLEQTTLLRMSEVIQQVMPKTTQAVLSGPSLASDVAYNLPVAVTAAASSYQQAKTLAKAFESSNFATYSCTDIVGVELGGVLKNVYAIAAGIIAGKKLGASAQANLLVRSFSEISKMSTALGAYPDTLTGLPGLGDLVLSSHTTESRNFALGVKLSQKNMTNFNKLTEGMHTAAAAVELAQKYNLEMPILTTIFKVLSSETTVDLATEKLLGKHKDL